MRKTYCVAVAIIIQNRRYFIAKRAMSKKIKPGLWEFVTGFTEDHEAAEDTVLRELQEEIGVNGKIIKSLDLFKMDEEDISWVVIPFLVEVDNAAIQITPEEHELGKWISLNELEKIPQQEFRYDKTKIKRVLSKI